MSEIFKPTCLKIAGAFVTALVLIWMLAGCTVVSSNRVFPKLVWYWSSDAQQERSYYKSTPTPTPSPTRR